MDERFGTEAIVKDKLAIWAVLIFLGGVGYVCARASAYFSHRSQTTLSRWSKVECLVECRIQTGPHEPTAELPEPVAKGFVTRSIASYGVADIAISDIRVVAPGFLEPEIAAVEVMGFSGLAPPRVEVTLALMPAASGEAEIGSWPIHFTATAVLTKTYLERQLQPARQELAGLESAGTPAEKERARNRLGSLEDKVKILAQPHPLSGQGTLSLDSVSNMGGPAAKWGAWLFGIVAALLLGAGGLIGFLYLLSLRAGDMEP